MEEKKIIEGKFIKNFIIFPVAFTVIGLFVLLVIIPYLAGFSSFEFMLFLPIISAVIAISWVLFFYANNCALTITDSRVFGRAAFGKRVDLPIDSISAIGARWPKGVAVATSSGRIAFLLLANNDEVYECVSKLLIERQASSAKQTTIKQEVPLSNADELKKYKELLDTGIITQEEFDAKKKQLLGL